MQVLEAIDEMHTEEREKHEEFEAARNSARTGGGHHFVSRK